MKKTLTNKLVHALTQYGCKEVQFKSHKYRTFVHPLVEEKRFYFVGKAGALRVGTCSSKSVSVPNLAGNLLTKYPMP